jgi:hypothetical protein
MKTISDFFSEAHVNAVNVKCQRHGQNYKIIDQV